MRIMTLSLNKKIMEKNIEVFEGEMKIKFTQVMTGKVSFKELGLTNGQLRTESGFLRLVVDLNGISEHNYFAVPTIEFSYEQNLSETHWQCEFNGETILDKIDNHGSSTILLLDRTKLKTLAHRHENQLIIHAEFPEKVDFIAEKSFIQLFK